MLTALASTLNLLSSLPNLARLFENLDNAYTKPALVLMQ
jgi:hypothetical protein